MITLSGILWGLAAIALGILGLRFTYQIVNLTGNQDWIESKIGSGSTYGAYKFFAIVLVIGGILEATGLMPGLMKALVSPLRGMFPH